MKHSARRLAGSLPYPSLCLQRQYACFYPLPFFALSKLFVMLAVLGATYLIAWRKKSKIFSTSQ